MLELPHTLVGAAIATQVETPWVALPLALASHFALDLVPHWNPHLYSEMEKYGKSTQKSRRLVAADATLSLISGGLIAARALPDIRQFILILAACFMAVAPDVVEAPFFFLGARWKWLERLIDWQREHQGKAGVKVGLLTQAVVIAICLGIIFI